jgi:hypothetical protein
VGDDRHAETLCLVAREERGPLSGHGSQLEVAGLSSYTSKGSQRPLFETTVRCGAGTSENLRQRGSRPTRL